MKSLSVAILVCVLVAPIAFGQTQATPSARPSPPPSAQDVEVIRVSTELVQTDVMVFDKKGHFVDGLQRDQFELRVDGKPQSVSLFDRVVAGSQKEEQLVSARKNPAGAAPIAPGSNVEQRGRTVVFFIDDLHLSARSVQKTRQAILEFVEKEMGSSDQVAIASASGQIGFLQQFTDNKTVLRAAVARLNHRPYTIQDAGGATIPMTEYTALKVDQGDRDAIDYYASQALRESNVKIRGTGGLGPPSGGAVGQPAAPRPASAGMTRELAERLVKERANNMMRDAASVTNNTLLGLESLMRSSAQFPGRKLVFLVSDGFFLNDRNTGFGEKLKQITDAALRSGAVIYSLDARGLVSMTDSTSNRVDPQGQLQRSNIGELAASQDPLNALAEDTGGRALLNSDALNGALTRALDETSNYYLLAWRPTEEEQKTKRYKRIEVSVIGRPELVVRLAKGYLQSQADTEMARADAGGNHARNTRDNHTPPTAVAVKDQPAKSVDAELNKALGAFANRRGLPTAVSVTFIDTPDNGPIITASVQASTTALDYGADNKEKAEVDIAGAVLNDLGKPVTSFKTRVSVAPFDSARLGDAGVVYNYKTPLKPGLYQVRTAARDQKSGKVGSASQWIEIPDLSTHKLTLSSLLLISDVTGGEAKPDAATPGMAAVAPQIQFSVDRRFKKSSQLSFWIFIYNTLRGTNGASAPDVAAQIQMSSNGKAIVNSPLRKLETAGMTDLQRIPYGGQFPLANLPAGRYDLKITITDQIAKASVSEHVTFQVE